MLVVIKLCCTVFKYTSNFIVNQERATPCLTLGLSVWKDALLSYISPLTLEPQAQLSNLSSSSFLLGHVTSCMVIRFAVFCVHMIRSLSCGCTHTWWHVLVIKYQWFLINIMFKICLKQVNMTTSQITTGPLTILTTVVHTHLYRVPAKCFTYTPTPPMHTCQTPTIVEHASHENIQSP